MRVKGPELRIGSKDLKPQIGGPQGQQRGRGAREEGAQGTGLGCSDARKEVPGCRTHRGA